MKRFLYFAGFTYIALCGAVVARRVIGARVLETPPVVVQPPAPLPSGTSGQRWFAEMKPFCNPVEVEVRHRFRPAPATTEGTGYAAACFALAGKIERARQLIDAMPARDRGAAAGVLFNVAHPVADAGDDRSSGPMMQLVLEYWPNNYMALYHAGMSAFSLGQTALAEQHLRAFLRLYNAPDGFTSAARSALERIERDARGRALEAPDAGRPR